MNFRSMAWLVGVTVFASPFGVAGSPPNVVLVMIDDLGWTDVGCYGNDFVDTPHIDQLAADGIRFTDFYAAGAVCSPTRAALQSGQNQARCGITAHIPGHWRPFERVITPPTAMALPTDIVTIAEALKPAGYSTGYIGKWHLGNGPAFQPDRQGYDISQVINGPHLPGRYRLAGRDPEIQPKPGQYRTEFEADLACDFIRDHRNETFFLMVSPFAVHIPLGAMSEKVAKYRARAEEVGRELPHPVYAAMIEHCDDMIGRLVKELDEQSLTEKTLFIFTSDNGGLARRYDFRADVDDHVSTQAPLKGEKGSLHEGGVRVPLIIKYPPLVTPGTTCSEPTISYDFYPTLVDVAGGKLPENQTIDGSSLVPLLRDADATLSRSALHWHYPHYHHSRPASSIRERDWKLIEYLDGTGDVELYHLAADLSEENNLVAEKPGRRADLQRKLAAWRAEVVAAMPIRNPSFDENRAGQWWNRRSGEPVESQSRKRFPPTEKEDVR
ncbi:MAG: sulfatase [Planctomycetota bacterium]